MCALVELTITLLLVSAVYSQSDCFHNEKNTAGVCIAVKFCESAKKEIIEFKQNIRKILPQTCRFEENVPIVCCALNIPSKAEQKCKEYKEEFMKVLKEVKVPQIVKGDNASDGEFPHMAAVGFQRNFKIEWSCGGSLISDRFVLTAAHCKLHPDFGEVKYVQLGDIKLADTPNSVGVYDVIKIYLHPSYQPPKSYNDIALLELDRLVKITAYIKPACLHTIPNDKDVGKYRTLVTGWGRLDVEEKTSEILQKVEIQKFDECSSFYRPQRKLPAGIDENLQICYGSKTDRKDSCHGDSGGPLQFFDFKMFSYRIIGIVSFGTGCGSPGYPSVYVKVASYAPWIESVIWP